MNASSQKHEKCGTGGEKSCYATYSIYGDARPRMCVLVRESELRKITYFEVTGILGIERQPDVIRKHSLRFRALEIVDSIVRNCYIQCSDMTSLRRLDGRSFILSQRWCADAIKLYNSLVEVSLCRPCESSTICMRRRHENWGIQTIDRRSGNSRRKRSRRRRKWRKMKMKKSFRVGKCENN